MYYMVHFEGNAARGDYDEFETYEEVRDEARARLAAIGISDEDIRDVVPDTYSAHTVVTRAGKEVLTYSSLPVYYKMPCRLCEVVATRPAVAEPVVKLCGQTTLDAFA